MMKSFRFTAACLIGGTWSIQYRVVRYWIDPYGVAIITIPANINGLRAEYPTNAEGQRVGERVFAPQYLPDHEVKSLVEDILRVQYGENLYQVRLLDHNAPSDSQAVGVEYVLDSQREKQFQIDYVKVGGITIEAAGGIVSAQDKPYVN